MLNPSPVPVKVIEELVRGIDFANQLLRHVINGGDGSSSSEATTPLTDEQLVDKVLMSFTNSLLLLNNSTSDASDVKLRDTPSYWINDHSKSEGFHQGNCNTTIIKRRRGCYDRRISSKARVVESETPVEDGHQWKKYGHKKILSAKYMRTYYRCSNKYDQGCQATKQVQRVQDDPPIHKTIYYANHTCRNLLNPNNILHSNSASDSSVLLSFENTLPAKQDRPFLSSSSFPSSFPELTFDRSYSRDVTLSSTFNSDQWWGLMSGFFNYSAELDQALAFDTFLEF